MKRLQIFTLLAICLLLVLASCNVPPRPPTSSTMTESSSPTATKSELVSEALVVRIIDGDTIEVNMGDSLYKVRYIGVDTPELGQWGGEEAKAANSQLVQGRVVELEKDVSETDRYGRLLRYVWVDGTMVNAALLAMGYAQASTYPPDVKYQDDFLKLQGEAREEGAGLWGLTEETETTPPQPTGEYVGSINSDVYHYPTCGYAQRIYPENLIWFSSPEDARAQGYRPCKVCRPP